MVGNLAAVTVAPARMSAPSGQKVTTPELPGGKTVAETGQDLPVPKPSAAPADLARTVGKLNETLAAARRNLSFRIDEGSGRTVITVVDAVTHEVVRQIPTEEVLALARALDCTGAFVDACA